LGWERGQARYFPEFKVQKHFESLNQNHLQIVFADSGIPNLSNSPLFGSSKDYPWLQKTSSMGTMSVSSLLWQFPKVMIAGAGFLLEGGLRLPCYFCLVN